MIFELSRRTDGQDLYLLTHPLIEGHKNPAFNVIMHKSVEILREKDFANSAILYMMTYIFFLYNLTNESFRKDFLHFE